MGARIKEDSDHGRKVNGEDEENESKSMTKLTPKQEKFCQEIVKGRSQSDAYRIAFKPQKMKNKSIHEKASQYMAEVKIRSRIQELQAPVLAKVRVTREQWLEKMQSFFLADVRKMFVGPGQLVEIHDLGEHEALLIEGFDVEENFAKVGDKAEHVGYTKKVRLTKALPRMLEFGKVMGWYQEDEPDNGPKTIIIRKFVAQEVQHVHNHSNGAILDGMRDGGTASATHSAAAGISTVADGASGGGGADRSDAGPATSPQCAVGAGISKHLPAECVPAAEQPVSNGIRRRTISPRVPVKKQDDLEGES